jgi:hypothetical protein
MALFILGGLLFTFAGKKVSTGKNFVQKLLSAFGVVIIAGAVVQLWTPVYLTSVNPEMIKDMADYKRLKKSITNLEELDKLKLDALDGSGGRLKERLHKASRMIIKEDTQRLRMEQQREIQKQQREIANRNAEPAVLKPTDNF